MVFVRLAALLFFSTTVFAEQPQQPAPQTPQPRSLVNLTSAPTSVVNGSVNVITGNYIESDTDYVVSGPDPYVLGHSYINTDLQKGNLGFGWNFYHNKNLRVFMKKGVELPKNIDTQEGWYYYPQTIKEFERMLFGDETLQPKGHEDTHVYVIDSGGGTLLFKGDTSWQSMKLVTKKTGFSNSFAGEISGKTNLKNMEVSYDRAKSHWKVYCGDGTKRYYTLVKKPPKKPDPLKKSSYLVTFRLTRERKPSGNVVHYDYDDHGKIHKIKTVSPDGNTLNWVRFYHKEDKIEVETSDDKTFTFYLTEVRAKNKKKAYAVSRIKRPGLPDETFDYEEKDDHHDVRVEKKKHSDGYVLKNRYFKHDHNKIGHKKVHSDSKNKFLCNRVSAQYAKISKGQKELTHTHTYHYHKKDKKVRYSDVVDPTSGNITRYHYNTTKRLTCIEWLNKEKKLLQKESYTWGTGKDEGNLLVRTLFNEKDKPIFSRVYRYDDRGNVVKEALYGSITGTVTPLQLDKDGLPKKSCECVYRRCTYDELNNKTAERDILGNMIYYEYKTRFDGKKNKKNTNLLAAKFSCVSQDIIKREFFLYDKDNILITSISDDGSSKDINDLTNVTHRHITRITPRKTLPHFGEPEIIEEYYLDGGKEVLLTKTVNIFNKNGLVTKQQLFDANNVFQGQTKTRYDEYDRVIYKKDPLGREETFGYDEVGNLVTKRGPRKDFHTEYGYDLLGRLTFEREIYSDRVLSASYEYDTFGRKIASTNAQGHTTRYEYDGLSRLTKIIFPQITLPDGVIACPIKEYRYSAGGSTVIEVNEKKEETITRTNIFGNVTFTQFPDKTTTEARYDLLGNKVLEKAPNGTTSHFIYDGLSRLIRSEIRDGSAVLSKKELHYNRLLLDHEIGAMQEELHFTYDKAGRKKETLLQGDGQTRRMAYCYDALGRVYEERTFYGSGESDYLTKKTTYDILSRPIAESLEDVSGTRFSSKTLSYDQEGNVSEVSTPIMGKMATTKTEYYPHGIPAKITNALGHTTTVHFDYFFLNHRKETVVKKTTTDPRGVTTEEIFEKRGLPEIVRTFDPARNKIAEKRLFYDISGCLIKTEEDAISHKGTRTITIELSYGVGSRLERIIEASNTPEQKETRFAYNVFGQKEKDLRADGSTISYTYDKKGRLATQASSDLTVSYEYTYDAADKVISVTNLLSNKETTRAYDKLGNLLQETLENGATMAYQHDKLGRVTTITYPDNSTATYTYSPAFLKSISRGSSTYTITQRDESGKIVAAELPGNTGTITYNYDLLGRCIASTHPQFSENNTEFDPAGNLLRSSFTDHLGTINSDFGYDSLSQLTKESGIKNHNYSYDSLNNRLQKDDDSYDVNSLHFVKHDSKNSYEHDRNGNRTIMHTSNGDITYHYDALDRLTSIQKADRTIKYSYDAFHRRICKETDSTTERYLYTVENEVGFLDVDGVIRQLRVLGEGLGAEIGATVLIETSSTTYIPLHDLRGNIHTLLDESGFSHTVYHYTAFGEVTNDSLTCADNPWRFCGKRTDEETGLVYFGRRYYDPSLGKWLTQDPLGLKAGPNLYAYVLNNPLTHVDLYGLFLTPRSEGYEDHNYRDCIGLPSSQHPGRDWLSVVREARCERLARDRDSGRSVRERFREIQERVKEIRECVAKTTVTGLRLLGFRLGEPLHSSLTALKDMSTSLDCKQLISSRKLSSYSFSLGILNTSQDAKEQAERIQSLFAGCSGSLVQTYSLGIWDLGRIAMTKAGFGPDSEGLLKAEILSDYLKNPGGTFLRVAHSWGGAKLANVLKAIPKDILSRTDIITLGTTKVITTKEFSVKSALNIIQRTDFTTLFFDSYGLIKAYKQCPDEVKFVGSWCHIPFTTHPVKEYLPYLKDALNIYREEE